MAEYNSSGYAYDRDGHQPSPYGRAYDRSNPSYYGRSDATGHTPAYGGSYQTYPATTRPSSGWPATKDYGMAGGPWQPSPTSERLKFDDHVTKVAMEYIQPRRSDSSMYRRSSSPTKTSGYNYKPSGHSYDAFPRNEYNYSSGVPVPGGMLKTSQGGYTTSSAHQSTGRLSPTTNDIGTAVHYLDEAARITAPGSRIADTTSKIHSYVHKGETVEPNKRYGTYNVFGRR